ncbi:unnamed protein product [Mytilus coruscus]|uniref:Uncharacterized protein n=1 Tax=Mytilus coruscus TaxID=42192 RepID=A0A6J8EU06_MYTCO|nr:unnamed protein product [Mytilus coruscus]
MSERNEDFSDHESGSKQGEPSAAVNQESSESRQDLVDTSDLFKTNFDHKLSNLKSEIISEQEHLSYEVKEDINFKFRSEGNKIQYRFNEEILSGVSKLQKHSSATEDEKKLRQAETRAIKSIKEKRNRPAPYSRPPSNIRSETAPNPNSTYSRRSTPQQPFRQGFTRRELYPWDICFLCKKIGHWKNTVLSTLEATRTHSIQATKSSKAPKISVDTLNDKYFIESNCNIWDNIVLTDLEIFFRTS